MNVVKYKMKVHYKENELLLFVNYSYNCDMC